MERRQTRVRRQLAVALLMLVICMPILFSGKVAASGPDVRLRPDDGPVRTSSLARGRDFPAGAQGVILWEDGSTPLAEFTADDEGEFEVPFTVPDVEPGEYDVTATSGDISTDDTFTVEASDPEDRPVAADSTPPDSVTLATPLVSAELAVNVCEMPASREVEVATSVELEAALADAQPGDHILPADGTYTGNFVAEASGTDGDPIALCGSPDAVIDGGGWEHSGYALHITGDAWTVHGITVTNAQKGVMLDGANHVVLDQIEVHTIGHEAVHFRTHSSDNVIQDSDIHDTGLDNEKFGEGVYLGSAVSNWERYTDGEPDKSDRNQVLRNRIWNTSSESIDIKEGTEGGLIEGNVFDGSGLTGADSWVDVKGNGYIIRGNTGTNSPEDGFQTHVINDMEWGRDNVFEQNTATVHGTGYGFYIHDPDTSANVVRCDNVVNDAGSGFTNMEGGCTD